MPFLGMHVRTPSFKVVADGRDGEIPVSVAGRIMMDIQSLIVHIGAQMIEKEMMAVYEVPKEYLNRFILHITEVNGKSMTLSTKAQDKFTGSMMDDAVGMLTCIMDSDESVLPELIVNMFPDPKYRSWIIQDLDALSRDMKGYSISYDSMEASGTFKGTSEETIPQWTYPLPEDHPGTAVGLLYEDPLGRLRLACDKGDVDLGIPEDRDNTGEAESCGSNPYAVTGHLIFTKEGILSEIRNVEGLRKVQAIEVPRIISKDSDVRLESPVTALISYVPDSKLWILSNDRLDISATGRTWDDAVRAFHDAFMERMEGYDADEPKGQYFELIRVYSPAYHC